MFTGIVKDLGRVLAREERAGDVRLTIGVTALDLSHIAAGDSICVSGCCVTALEISPHSFQADLSRETLAVTTLGELVPGRAVNLEPALRAGDALGGHLVSGHVDAVARVLDRSADARSLRLTIEAPAGLARFIAAKGSICVDGVSLTVNETDPTSFGVNLIPHTQAVTTLGALKVGDRVNLEIDTVARYVARLLGHS